MSVHIFVSEYFGCFTVSDDFFRIFLTDFVKLTFADLARGDKIVIPIGIAMPGEILAITINRSVSKSKPDLI